MVKAVLETPNDGRAARNGSRKGLHCKLGFCHISQCRECGEYNTLAEIAAPARYRFLAPGASPVEANRKGNDTMTLSQKPNQAGRALLEFHRDHGSAVGGNVHEIVCSVISELDRLERKISIPWPELHSVEFSSNHSPKGAIDGNEKGSAKPRLTRQERDARLGSAIDDHLMGLEALHELMCANAGDTVEGMKMVNPDKVAVLLQMLIDDIQEAASFDR
ncbi:MAG: hypothetical protein R3D32_09655 [Nitratireductor sp.]